MERTINKKNKASIIIPIFNALEHTKTCLESLKLWTDVPHEVIIIDNGSSDGSTEYLENNPCVTFIKTDSNLGFAAASNLGISRSVSDYIVLANNDLIFTPRWLSKLILAAESNKRIGLVGPVTNKASGFHVELLFKYDTTEQMIEHSEAIYAKNRSFLLEVPFLIFFCVLIKRSTIDIIGDLDTSFGLGGCDDLDFSFRANKAGLCCAIDRSTFVHHSCSQTYKANQMDYEKLLIEAREKFKKKWGFPLSIP